MELATALMVANIVLNIITGSLAGFLGSDRGRLSAVVTTIAMMYLFLGALLTTIWFDVKIAAIGVALNIGFLLLGRIIMWKIKGYRIW